MNYIISAVILGTLCMASAVLCVISARRKWTRVRGVAKCMASSAFVALALVNGALGSDYGHLILFALLFSWAGDLLLLSRRSRFLLAGIATFLIAHFAFALGFASQSLDYRWLTISALILGWVSIALYRWLREHLEGAYRIAVPVYLAAILIMTTLAIALSFASGSPLVGIAALMFALSDVSVALDRFVEPHTANRTWGLPTYYAAQILFAASVLSHA